MNQAIEEISIPVGDPQPEKTKLGTYFTAAYLILFQCVRRLRVQYYQRVVFGGVAMPRSALSFITNALIALATIKSQFQTHHPTIMVSVSSLLIYGLASATELVVSCAGLDPTSAYAITAHLGKIISLCILVVSLASLFYM